MLLLKSNRIWGNFHKKLS